MYTYTEVSLHTKWRLCFTSTLDAMLFLGVFAIATNTCHLQSNLAKLWLGVGYLSVTKQHGDD